MSTSRRIQVGLLLVVFVVVSVGGVVVLITVRRELVERVDDQLVAGREALVEIDGLLTPEGIDTLARAAEQTDRASAVVVFDPGGEVVLSVPSGVGPVRDPLPDVGSVGLATLESRDEPSTVPAVDDSFDYRTIAVEHDGAVLVLATPLTDVTDTMRQVTLVLLASSVGSVVVIGLATSLVTRWAVRPVDEMIDSAVAIGHGDLTRRIETSSDHAEVVRLQEALNDMLHQLEEAFADRQASEERLRRFVADASHELRTPLASIRGYSELYLSGAAADREGTDRAMGRIQAEAVRTGALVEDLLLLARLDQGQELTLAPVDLTRVVTDSVADARAIDPERTLTLELPDHGVTVPGDEARLRQVVANLLANARAHAPGAQVTVSLADGPDGPTLAVADDGPGLAGEQAAHVFDRFWRADDTRNRRTGGAGLGLSISAAIAAAHGARIDVDSSPGHGARFTVRFPPPADSPPALPPRPGARSGRPSRPDP